jgi:hypothetical protein
MKRRVVLMLVLLAGLEVPVLAQTPQGTPMPYMAIHQPEFVAASGATFLQDDDILLGITSGNVANAYPAADLSQHGAVFDKVPDGPISVAWCGVCNTGLVFHAELKGRTLHFQYDRMVAANEVQKDLETGSSWQQATGEAIDGPLKGTRLKLYPVVRTTWAEWRRRYPHTMVLKPLPGYAERVSSTIDLNTRSTWNAYGLCLEGPLKGTQLRQMILVPQFWFAWSQFHQGTRVFTVRSQEK